MNEKNRKKSESGKLSHETRRQRIKAREELQANLEVFMKASDPEFEKKVEAHLHEERKRFVKAEAQKYFQKEIVENRKG